MSDRRTTRHERDGGSSDEHLLDRDKQLERQTETDDARHAHSGDAAAAARRKAVVERDTRDEPLDRVDEASEESFPASDPPQQP